MFKAFLVSKQEKWLYYKCLVKVFSKLLCKKYTDSDKSPDLNCSSDRSYPDKPIVAVQPKENLKKTKLRKKSKKNYRKLVRKLPCNKPARVAQQEKYPYVKNKRVKRNFGVKKLKELRTTNRTQQNPDPTTPLKSLHKNDSLSSLSRTPLFSSSSLRSASSPYPYTKAKNLQKTLNFYNQ